MSRKIVVDPSKLKTAADKIDGMAAEYEKQYNQLFNEVDGMGAAWKGADNTAYVTQIKGFMDDFQKMRKLMTDYSEFLKQSAQVYQKAQDDIVAGAKSLRN